MCPAPRGDKLEKRNGFHQPLRLILQAARGSGHLLHQCGVLLGDMVHLDNGHANLRHTRTLFVAGRAEMSVMRLMRLSTSAMVTPTRSTSGILARAAAIG